MAVSRAEAMEEAMAAAAVLGAALARFQNALDQLRVQERRDDDTAPWPLPPWPMKDGRIRILPHKETT